MILTLHAHNLRLSLRHIITNNHSSQFPALDTSRIKTFTVRMQLEALMRVVTVDDRRALVRG